jgi:hypothetical protein
MFSYYVVNGVRRRDGSEEKDTSFGPDMPFLRPPPVRQVDRWTTVLLWRVLHELREKKRSQRSEGWDEIERGAGGGHY